MLVRRHLSCWNTQYSVDIKKKEEEGEDEEENTTPTHKLKRNKEKLLTVTD